MYVFHMTNSVSVKLEAHEPVRMATWEDAMWTDRSGTENSAPYFGSYIGTGVEVGT